jgi:hypothetical protein
MHEFAKKRPINVIVRRIRKNDKAYTLDDARVIQYRVRGPGDPQAGPSDPKILLGDSPVESAWIADLNPHDSISPCFTIDAFSICTFGSKPMYAFGHDVDSLFTLHSDHYYQKLANCDLFTLMQIYGAAHPPFQSNAIVPKLDQRAYQQLLHWDAIKVDPKTWMDAPLISTVPENATRTDTGGYLMPELMDSTQTNLFLEYQTFNGLAQRYLLETAQQIAKSTTWEWPEDQLITSKENFFTPRSWAVRMDRAVCFQVEHVKIESFAEAQASCNALKQKTANKSYPAQFEIRANQ